MLDQLSICVFSYLFFCWITFFFLLLTSFLLFMCVIYDVWCFMKRFGWFFSSSSSSCKALLSSLLSLSLQRKFELWQSRSGASQSPLPVLAAAATTARLLKWSFVWFECERSHSSLFQTFLTVSYLSCLDHQLGFFFFFLVKAMFNLPQTHYLSCCKKAVKFKTMVNTDITRFS